MAFGRPVVDCLASGEAGKSRTRQSETESCDLNKAVARYRKTRALTGPLISSRKSFFGDFVDAPFDYLSAMASIKTAEQQFLSLPARLRERFGNDPYQLLSFLSDDKNYQEAVKLGLIEDAKAAGAVREPEQAEQKTEPVAQS